MIDSDAVALWQDIIDLLVENLIIYRYVENLHSIKVEDGSLCAETPMRGL